MFQGKKVLIDTQVERVVETEFEKANGCGARALSLRLHRKYSGLSEKVVDKILKKSSNYHKHFPKFTNVPKQKVITATNVGERWQIDLMDMRRESIEYRGESYQYILTVMDIYSRYVFLRPLTNKTSKLVKQEVESIILEHGPPHIIQCDNGTEFRGSMQKLYRKYDIKVIRSSPYHPQSQGKVERVHRSVRKKLMFKSRQARGYSNWAKSLNKVSYALNTTPKACLGNHAPHDIYFGRLKKNPKTDLQKATKTYKKRIQSKSKASEYMLQETVLIKYPFTRSSRVPKRRYILEAVVINRNLKKEKYELRFRDPKGRLTTAWVGVEFITSLTVDIERKRKKQKKTNRFYIVTEAKTEAIDLWKDGSIKTIYDPSGNGNCQFAAFSHQLSRRGIFQSEQSLRKLACDHITQNSHYYEEFLEGDVNIYIRRMQENGTFGDHITLLAISRELNMQIMVVSIQGFSRCI